MTEEIVRSQNSATVLTGLMEEYDKKDWIIAEIGIWKSHTLKKMLRANKDIIAQYWAIDFWHYSKYRFYRGIPVERWDALYFYACRLMRFFPQLHTVRMSSLEAAKLFPEKYFDLVFIDADHSYDAVVDDIRAWRPLIKDGGLLTGHDYGGKKRHVKAAVHDCLDDVELAPKTIWVKRL